MDGFAMGLGMLWDSVIASPITIAIFVTILLLVAVSWMMPTRRRRRR
ncbi:hypothetical protein [Homoserinimonas sp. OAct 916]|nr:hypothetical protein [Homoserinimonas sp. OAct 916]